MPSLVSSKLAAKIPESPVFIVKKRLRANINNGHKSIYSAPLAFGKETDKLPLELYTVERVRMKNITNSVR